MYCDSYNYRTDSWKICIRSICIITGPAFNIFSTVRMNFVLKN